MKTRNEASIDFSFSFSDGVPGHKRRTAFNAGIDFAGEWYPISEKPNEDMSVILMEQKEDGSRVHAIGFYLETFIVWDTTGIKATHWRPIEIK